MFSGLSLQLKRVEEVELVKGFKSLSVTTDRRQYIEAAKGFKGISLGITATGNVQRILKEF